MNYFNLQIVTPDGLIFNEQIYQLLIRGTEGEVSVLANHIPYVTALRDGECRIYSDSGKISKRAEYSGGFLYVQKQKTTIVTSEFK